MKLIRRHRTVGAPLDPTACTSWTLRLWKPRRGWKHHELTLEAIWGVELTLNRRRLLYYDPAFKRDPWYIRFFGRVLTWLFGYLEARHDRRESELEDDPMGCAADYE